jgi:hypothetical protein
VLPFTVIHQQGFQSAEPFKFLAAEVKQVIFSDENMIMPPNQSLKQMLPAGSV